MEIRRFGDTLFRYRISPLLSFHLPSVSSLPLHTTATCHKSYSAPGNISTSRGTTAERLARRYASSTAANNTTTSGSSHKEEPPQDSPSASDAFGPAIDKLLRDTLNDRPSPGGTRERTSDYINPYRIGKTSSDSVTDVFNRTFGKQKPTQGAFASAMEMPNSSSTSSTKVSKDVSSTLINPQEPATRASLTVRSRPSVGRTVEINPERGVDLGRGLQKLEVTCYLNNVRIDAARQKFHERPGLKRKRLKSERWRKKFQIGFRHVVGKVKVMRRKGW